MTKKQFIQKAIEGGYYGYQNPFCQECGEYEELEPQKHASIFLDPKAWEAVGKVEGWNESTYKKLIRTTSTSFRTKTITVTRKSSKKKNYVAKMHQMIDALAEGKNTQDFIETL